MQIIEIITILTNFKTNSTTADSFKHTLKSAGGLTVCKLPFDFCVIVWVSTHPLQAMSMVYLLIQCTPINLIDWHSRPVSRMKINM